MNTTRYLCVLLSLLLVAAPLPAQTAGFVTGAPDVAPPPGAATDELSQVRVVANDGAEVPAGTRSSKGITVEVKDAAGAGVTNAAVAVRLPESGPSGTFEDGTHSAIAYTDSNGRAQINGIRWNSSPGVVTMRVTASKGTSHAGVLLEEKLTEPASADAAAVADSQSVRGPLEIAGPLPSPPAFPEDSLPIAKSGASGATIQPGTPAHPQLPGAASAQAQQPSVSVTTTGATADRPHSAKKWLIAAVVAAGAGGAMLAMRGGKSSAPAPVTPSLSIGSPSISIGHP
jgi:hypothetical protein